MSATKKTKISIVIPVFNEENNIVAIVRKIESIIPRKFDTEFILVDDGSLDGSRSKIEDLTKNSKVKSIYFYRNFGHQSALLAGILFSSGDAVVTIDADFQHPPEKIIAMIEKWEEGSDLVLGQKIDDKSTPLVLRVIRSLGYSTYKFLMGDKILSGVSDFRLMDKTIVTYLKMCSETRFVLRGLVSLPAKKVTVIPYAVGIRLSGKSGYSLSKLAKLYVDSVTSFSVVPLRLASLVGLSLTLLASIYLVYVIIAKFFSGKMIIEGWTAIIFLMVVLFGFLFIYLGLIGEYLGAIFDDVKQRPRYLIESTKNIKKSI